MRCTYVCTSVMFKYVPQFLNCNLSSKTSREEPIISDVQLHLLIVMKKQVSLKSAKSNI